MTETNDSRGETPLYSKIKWFGFDMDGVMTDGGIILQDDGTQAKRFHSRDGHAIKLLGRAGIKIAIITGRKSRLAELRAAELGVTELYQNSVDKLEVYQRILEKEGLSPDETAFMGDDLVDLPILVRAALPVCPFDAANEVKSECLYVTPSRGGHGAVRDAVEHLLKGKGLWEDILKRYRG
ncbi:MAG: HAD hydrolase family protein [Deltaproteobacteria bacterium]|jgi:3-deoxy-D-manno-octulosonate 8-phosphate phosphatase (KDO 8-P phosphatase)|nr:HAD hydrolase family protein [Deltaproteobacteria bacterium]